MKIKIMTIIQSIQRRKTKVKDELFKKKKNCWNTISNDRGKKAERKVIVRDITVVFGIICCTKP